MEASYIIVVSLYCCNDYGVVGHGERTSLALWFIGMFPCFSRAHSGFPPQREFKLVQCVSAYQRGCIWVHGKII
jgi:hypothetical protein